jgi:xanthosine utilization system XapX-like protein
MRSHILQFVAGTLMVVAAAILASVPNPAWPAMAAAGLVFWIASYRSYRSAGRNGEINGGDSGQDQA